MGKDSNDYNKLRDISLELRSTAQAAKKARSDGRGKVAALLDAKTKRLKEELQNMRKADFSKRQIR